LIYKALMISDVRYLFMCFLTILYHLWRNVCWNPFYWAVWFFIVVIGYRSSLYILDVKPI
jgi:hypothetical protein